MANGFTSNLIRLHRFKIGGLLSFCKEKQIGWQGREICFMKMISRKNLRCAAVEECRISNAECKGLDL